MKRTYCYLLISILLASLAIFLLPVRPYEDQLIRLQAEKELRERYEIIRGESTEIQAVMLDYADNKELVLKAELALMKYPYQVRKVFALFGDDPDFQLILKKYGEEIIPVIHYFLITDIKQTIRLLDKTGKLLHEIRNWREEKKEEQRAKELGSEQQAWYAIQFIKNEGHDFLGQFVINDQGDVEWIQIERVTEGLSAFFTSGLRSLETRYRTEQPITTRDLFWAGVDMLLAASTLKLLRAGKLAARSGKPLGMVRTTSLYGMRLLKSGVAGRLLKVSTIAAMAWVLINHPSLIPSAFYRIGEFIGISPRAAQFIGISMLAWLLLYPLVWLSRWIICPLRIVLRFLIMLMNQVEKRLT